MNSNSVEVDVDVKASPRPPSRLRIVKVGGSLFDLPDLPQRLEHVLASHATLGTTESYCNLLIPGGGALADAVRRYDAVFHLDSADVHDVAVQTMHLMALMLSPATSKPVISQMLEIAACRRNAATAILDVRELLSTVEPAAKGPALERTWAATSDSIAARVAHLLDADELWLLKSVTAPDVADLERLARDGVVDPCFVTQVRGLRWRLINLRDLDL